MEINGKNYAFCWGLKNIPTSVFAVKFVELKKRFRKGFLNVPKIRENVGKYTQQKIVFFLKKWYNCN